MKLIRLFAVAALFSLGPNEDLSYGAMMFLSHSAVKTLLTAATSPNL